MLNIAWVNVRKRNGAFKMTGLINNVNHKTSLVWLVIVGIMLIALPVLTAVFVTQQTIYTERINLTKQIVSIAHNIIDYEYQLELTGQKSHKRAQADALAAISRIKYSDGGYVWVNDFSFRMLYHPTNKLVGKNVEAVLDSAGKPVFHEFMTVSENTGEGTITYQWNRPHYAPEVTFEKTSSIKRFRPWGWVIGAGVYVDDMRTTLLRKTIWYFVLLSTSLVLLGNFAYVGGRYVFTSSLYNELLAHKLTAVRHTHVD